MDSYVATIIINYLPEKYWSTLALVNRCFARTVKQCIRKIDYHVKDKNSMLEEFAKNGAIWSILWLEKYRHLNYERGLIGACIGGHMDIVSWMIARGAKDFNTGLIEACYRGHLDIVLLMIEKGADKLDQCLYYACYKGHIHIVHLMIEKGAVDWNSGLTGACIMNHLDIVRLMLQKGAWHCGCGGPISQHYKK